MRISYIDFIKVGIYCRLEKDKVINNRERVELYCILFRKEYC